MRAELPHPAAAHALLCSSGRGFAFEFCRPGVVGVARKWMLTRSKGRHPRALLVLAWGWATLCSGPMESWSNLWCQIPPTEPLSKSRHPRCALLLAEYLGYAAFTADHLKPSSGWWQLHPPAAVVPARCGVGHSFLDESFSLSGGCASLWCHKEPSGGIALGCQGHMPPLQVLEVPASSLGARWRSRFGGSSSGLLGRTYRLH